MGANSVGAESLRCETSFRRILVETTGIETTRCRTPKVSSISHVLWNAFTALTSNYPNCLSSPFYVPPREESALLGRMRFFSKQRLAIERRPHMNKLTVTRVS